MISVQEAEQKIAERLVPFTNETVPIESASGRVLAESLQADRDLPPFNRSTFDGIAVSSRAVAAGQRTFPIAGTAYAGAPKTKLENTSDCVEIMTGAPVPDNADCVVKVEDLAIENGVATLSENALPTSGYGIHPQGSDMPSGQVALQSGCRLTAKELSVAASIGKTQLAVAKAPRISIVTTGDELVAVSETPEPHQIRRSNDLALDVALATAGYSRTERHHIPDDPAATEAAVERILEQSDIVILAGGVSKGKRDYLPAALENAGVEKAFQWVRQRPGKPLWFGNIQTNGQTRYVFALPGNPVSCFTCLHRYTIPALDALSGLPPAAPRYAKLDSSFEFKPPIALFLPVTLRNDESGQTWAQPLPFNTSGDYVSVARTQGFIELPESETEFPQGAPYRFHSWQT